MIITNAFEIVGAQTGQTIVGQHMARNRAFLGRADEGIGEGPTDSVSWAFEVHAGIPDDKRIVCAILYGNEDCPERIEFYTENDYRALPAFVWIPDEQEEGR